MLPLILVAVGAYLIGDSVLSDKKYAKGGQLDAKSAKKRLEQLRKELRAERISYGELIELENLKEYIDENDIELKQAAGIPEFEDEDEYAKGGYMAKGGKMDSLSENGKKVFNQMKREKVNRYYVSYRTVGQYADDMKIKLSEKEMNDVADLYVSTMMSDGGMMAKGGVMPKGARSGIKIKNWYVKNYPTDELGEDINDTITFKGYWAMTSQGYNPYEVLGVDDSVVRERVDGKLSEILGVDNYEYKKGGKLVGKQKNLDVNKNGKLDAEDFKILRGEKMAKGGKAKDYDGEKYRVADVYYSDRRKDLFIVTESKPTYIVVKYKDGFVDKITKAELKELKESGDLDYIDKNVNLLDKYIFKDAFYKGK
jgi:hypothetical protein